MTEIDTRTLPTSGLRLVRSMPRQVKDPSKSAVSCLPMNQAKLAHAAMTGDLPELSQIFARALRLTPALARFVSTFVAELDLHKACKKLGLQYETGRSYMKQLYLQTGTRSQTQLVVYLLWVLRSKVDQHAVASTLVHRSNRDQVQ